MKLPGPVPVLVTTLWFVSSNALANDFEHVYQNIKAYEIEEDPATWQTGVAKICETSNNCVFIKMWEGALAADGQTKKYIAFFAKDGSTDGGQVPYEKNYVDPLTMEKLKKQWEDIQRVCQIGTGIFCGIAAIPTPPLGAACGVASLVVCSLSPEELGIERCDIFDPQPGMEKSYKLTPASKKAKESADCWSAAEKTLTLEEIPAAIAFCASSLPGSDICVTFSHRCYFQTEVSHPAGTDVPPKCKNVVE